MKQVLLFDTAIATSNIGDEIILESVKQGLSQILENALIFRLGTHIENFNAFQMINNWKVQALCNQADYKFVCGTNLLTNNIKGRFSQWQVNRYNYSIYNDAVLVGVGRISDYDDFERFTRKIYQKILSKRYIHSVRDEQTRLVLEKIGIKAYNTGCPTLWNLTPDLCEQIPQNKADNVIFSVSGYFGQSDYISDCELVEILKSNYKGIYAWIQTVADESYLRTIPGTENIQRVYSLETYSKILKNKNIDYVGTRLHGGIYALQHGIRSLVISIDERAKGFHESNNLPIIDRKDIKTQLLNKIYGRWETNIYLKQENINAFLSQFQ